MAREIKVRARQLSHLFTELFAQHPRLDFLDRAFGQFCELEWAVGDADQPVHLKAEMRHHVAHLAILAFADREHQPHIGALVTLQRRLDRPVFDAIDLDAVFERIELGLSDFTVRADAVAPQPAGVGQFERARQAAVIGKQQQALGIEVEPADAD